MDKERIDCFAAVHAKLLNLTTVLLSIIIVVICISIYVEYMRKKDNPIIIDRIKMERMFLQERIATVPVGRLDHLQTSCIVLTIYGTGKPNREYFRFDRYVFGQPQVNKIMQMSHEQNFLKAIFNKSKEDGEVINVTVQFNSDVYTKKWTPSTSANELIMSNDRWSVSCLDTIIE